MDIDPGKLMTVARECAVEAGRLILEKSETGFSIAKKGRANLVTEADLDSERLIVERIRSQYPDHQILAEEGGAQSRDSNVKWVIDPIDGTTNYAHRYPCYCVSIGVEINGEICAGVVYNPVLDECFTAVQGGGAFLNNRVISVSGESSLEESLLVTGFSYGEVEIRRNLRLFNRMMMESRSVRRDGSAALDLCHVACGRFEGFWELHLSPWDVAAGTLIVQEAGGRVSRFNGDPSTIYDRECLATNGRVHDQIAEILRQEP